MRPLLPALLALSASAALLAQTPVWRPDSTVPLVQLTGEHFQLFDRGNLFTAPTPGRTMSRSGLVGADLGYPVVYPDKILILFGDSIGSFHLPRFGDRFFLAKGSGGGDSIGYIPNQDLSQCHYIEDVARRLESGDAHPNVSMAGCPALRLYENPGPEPGEPRYQQTFIGGLRDGEGVGPFETPSGAFDLDGTLYMFYVVRIQDGKPHLALESILARSQKPVSDWSDRRPPLFERLSVVSSHPPVPDVANPGEETDGPGKFMFNPVAVMDSAALRASGAASSLPAELRSASPVVFVFGSSFRYNRSNLYLAAFALKDAAAGAAKWFYYSGRGGVIGWTKDETQAAPLLDGETNIGNHSVLWIPELRRFVLMYGNIAARIAPQPWGPWSPPIHIFGPENPWALKMVHRPGQDPIRRTIIPVLRKRDNQPWGEERDARGIPYGPYLIDRSSRNADGSVTLYFTMSTWNPYEVFLMRTTFDVR